MGLTGRITQLEKAASKLTARDNRTVIINGESIPLRWLPSLAEYRSARLMADWRAAAPPAVVRAYDAQRQARRDEVAEMLALFDGGEPIISENENGAPTQATTVEREQRPAAQTTRQAPPSVSFGMWEPGGNNPWK